MDRSLRTMFLSLVIILLGLCGSTTAEIQYCSSLNTGSDFESVFDNYQSNGACSETCKGDYAFAIVQGSYCWCSNAAPGDTESTDSCDETCPGFPSDSCGSTGEGLYGYVQLNQKPSTTVDGSTTTSTTTESSSVPVTTATESSSTTTSSLSSSSDTTLTTQTSPTVSVHTTDGEVVTVTAPVESATPASDDSDTEGTGSSVSGGAIAGIVVGSVAGVGIIVAALVWFCFYRRRQLQSRDDDYNSSFFERPVPRPTFQGTLGSREAAMAAGSGENGSNGSGPTHRLSVPAFTDSRLKSDADLYPNGNRHSNVSLQDNQDYSRPVLRLTNPDPPGT